MSEKNITKSLVKGGLVGLAILATTKLLDVAEKAYNKNKRQ